MQNDGERKTEKCEMEKERRYGYSVSSTVKIPNGCDRKFAENAEQPWHYRVCLKFCLGMEKHYTMFRLFMLISFKKYILAMTTVCGERIPWPKCDMASLRLIYPR